MIEIPFLKSSNAPSYQISDEYAQEGKTFNDVIPFVNSIYVDNGEDLVYITKYDGIIGDTIVINYEVIGDDSVQIICFGGQLEIFKEIPEEFLNAFDESGDMFQIELGFKDSQGNILEYFADEESGKEFEINIYNILIYFLR